jgi:L-glutamine-phosphate cytidylyltransferase
MPTTEDQPKCFAAVQGRRILDWILDAFAGNNVTDICFIGGYQIDKVRQDYPHFIFRHNVDWANNNILESLMYARDLMDQPFICCYADILFTPQVVAKLLANPADIALGVDTLWLDRYHFRTEHPPDDAEKVTVLNGCITRIHRDIASPVAHGEFIGVAKLSTHGAQLLKDHYARARQAHASKPFREAKVFEKAYLIHLFQDMVEHGAKLHHVDTPGEYMEVDTQQDFELAQIHWKGGA